MAAGIAVSPYNFIEGIGRERLPDRIVIYDSTLRDGEQMPGVAFTREQKLEIARKLDETRVPQIEAGFPSVSAEEKAVVKAIVKEGLDAEILSLSRIVKKDVDACIDCGIDMALLFVATSDLHLKYKLHREESEINQRSLEIMDYCRDHGLKVAFSTEDSTRTRLEYLISISKMVDSKGAARIGLTDTVGCILPSGMSYLVQELKKVCSKPISVHCHNDMGLALANALAGVEAGAEAIATTVNGMGERSGNVPLEEFAVAMKALYGRDLGLDLSRLKELSDLVAGFAKTPIQYYKPVVGRNAFAHESGIHVAALLENPETYEPIPPEMVGGKQMIILGKHTGKRCLKHLLKGSGFHLEDGEIEYLLEWLKRQASENGRVGEEEFWRRVIECTEGSDDV